MLVCRYGKKTVREDRVSFNSCISACQAAEWPLALRLAELSAAKGPLLVDDFNAPRGGVFQATRFVGEQESRPPCLEGLPILTHSQI